MVIIHISNDSKNNNLNKFSICPRIIVYFTCFINIGGICGGGIIASGGADEGGCLDDS